MVANGYQPAARFSPTGVGAAILVNAGLLAALMFAAPSLLPTKPPEPFTAYPVPLDPPPPPVEPEPVAEAAPRTDTPLPFVPIPIVPPTQPADTTIASTDTMPIGPVAPLTPPGSGGTATAPVVEAPPAPPVLVIATPDPRHLGAFQPDYPPSERRIERDGMVVVRVHVTATGRVDAVEQVSATSSAFFEATRRRALSHWRFRPATRDGAAIDSWREMSVRFRMEDLR